MMGVGARQAYWNVHRRGVVSVIPNRQFFGIFKNWSQRIVYPPSPQEISTNNRLFPTWINNATELNDIILFQEPLILNFTYSDARCNRVTESLFEVLADKELYPSDKAVNMANVAADSVGGRELMLRYSVGKIPTILFLKKQIPVDRFEPNGEHFKQDIISWIKKNT